MKNISDAQRYLQEMQIDGWLLYDFQRNNLLACQFLKIPPDQMTTRRFFYWIPQSGEPIKIVHAIEQHVLDHLPGIARVYLGWQSLEKEVCAALKGARSVAMEYSLKNAIPYISHVDAGTVDLIRSFGIEVVSSGNFLAQFTAVLTDFQEKSHHRAALALSKIVNDTWQWIHTHLTRGKPITEYDIQQKIQTQFTRAHLMIDHSPIVAFNAHSADPHYAPRKEGSPILKKGDFILIDLWAKEKHPEAVFGDITRVGVAAERPSVKQNTIFQIVRKAQREAVALIKDRFIHKQRIEGWEVDDAARKVIRDAGYGEFFIHRTGHSIGVDLHGSGTHMDNLEMHDVRPVLPGTCFSIEPGIYLPGEFGVRLEHDLYIHPDGTVEITGGEQDAIVCLRKQQPSQFSG